MKGKKHTSPMKFFLKKQCMSDSLSLNDTLRVTGQKHAKTLLFMHMLDFNE